MELSPNPQRARPRSLAHQSHSLVPGNPSSQSAPCAPHSLFLSALAGGAWSSEGRFSLSVKYSLNQTVGWGPVLSGSSPQPHPCLINCTQFGSSDAPGNRISSRRPSNSTNVISHPLNSKNRGLSRFSCRYPSETFRHNHTGLKAATCSPSHLVPDLAGLTW